MPKPVDSGKLILLFRWGRNNNFSFQPGKEKSLNIIIIIIAIIIMLFFFFAQSNKVLITLTLMMNSLTKIVLLPYDLLASPVSWKGFRNSVAIAESVLSTQVF